MDINVHLNSLRLKGNLAYEYNPFHNYLTDVDLYKCVYHEREYIIPEGCGINLLNGELLKKINTSTNICWIDKRNNIISEEHVLSWDSSDNRLYAKAGSLIDLDTEKLNFDLEHPVDIEVLPSYDGSVNLILNDGKNIPRIINSRFSVREKNTYEIVDRIGENDTNIYNSRTFDKDTSLYFLYEKNPIIKYLNYVDGTLSVGSYAFYFTYCDADDNESDYIAESGVIPIFLGNDKDPFSIDGGIKNLLSDKGISLYIKDIDKSYNYIKVYYIRYFADYQQNRVVECKKILRKYSVTGNSLILLITGYEDTEDLDPNILNISKFNPKSVKTQAQCKNILFFGNIVKNVDNYKELTDCALRIVPNIKINSNFLTVNNGYLSDNGNYGYYNSSNIYNNVGYMDQEYYRFGVVFIYNNGTLSNVYNVLGGTLTQNNNVLYKSNTLYEKIENNDYLIRRKYIQCDDDKWITNFDEFFSYSNEQRNFINSKGVCKIEADVKDDSTIIGIDFNVPDEVTEYLKELGIRGLFFVRLKRVPNILAQCYLLPLDKVLKAPVIEYEDNGAQRVTESFVELDLSVTNVYENRLFKYPETSDSIGKNYYVGICPDFLLNLPLYNQILNGNSFRLQLATISNSKLIKSGRFYSELNPTYSISEPSVNVTINTVTDDVSTIAIKNLIFKLNIGEAEESFRFEFINEEKEFNNNPDPKYYEYYNIARGTYSPYLAIYSELLLETSALYNIFKSNNINENLEYQNRINSSDAFYAISDRLNFEGITNNVVTCWRGDCYINTFTYRLNRNFNDPSLPNNDKIILRDTWKNNYPDPTMAKWPDISRSDINAVQLGSWITFKVRSSMNYALRSQDHSYVAEEALMGAPRSFYPRSGLLYRGENKMPDSYLYNDAFRATLGFKCYFALEEVNYIKDSFSNRIQYSEIAIQDSYKNNYRDSLNTYFRDYSSEYGSITKLVSFEGYLLVVFEHAIGIAVVNERIIAGSGDGEPVFINTKNVLPEQLTIISDTYGTQWPESVIKSEAGYVYGVDTIAKKIWRVKGQQIEMLSDFKVNKFLIDNITLGERETSPIIGLRNVKTHYNNNKKDIMFTFYDDVFEDEENVWNLCYNEMMDKFVTFYSWVPSYSENIDTLFFSFNRNTSKVLSSILKHNYNIPENTGILVSDPLIKTKYKLGSVSMSPITLYYRIQKSENTIVDTYGNIITVTNENFEEFNNVSFSLEFDHWQNYKRFKITSNNKLELNNNIKYFDFLQSLAEQGGVILLNIKPILEIGNIQMKTETISLTFWECIIGSETTKPITSDFYLHGQAGIFNVTENVYPCRWYDEEHPFEFEFVVNDKIGQQKIFTDLIIISNKAEPESFHFEIEGDNYEFSSDKRTMYFRQEATKETLLNLGSNILFNRKYTDVGADKYTYEQYYRGGENYQYVGGLRDKIYPKPEFNLVQQVKSSIFPLYYNRTNTYNDIYDSYQLMTGDSRDYLNLSGSEIIWNRDLNQFDVVTHIKNSPIDHVGRLRGNSRYKEGKWNIQIPSIIFNQKNEEKWDTPPLVLNYLPNDIDKSVTIKDLKESLPNTYDIGLVRTDKWTFRKEARIRDKWIKIKVRYSGHNLAVIHSLITLYNISYS